MALSVIKEQIIYILFIYLYAILILEVFINHKTLYKFSLTFAEEATRMISHNTTMEAVSYLCVSHLRFSCTLLHVQTQFKSYDTDYPD